MAAIMELPISEVTNYITHAEEVEVDMALWDLWSRTYPFMQAGLVKQVSFSDFKSNLSNPDRGKAQTPVTEEEIEKELMTVVLSYEERGH